MINCVRVKIECPENVIKKVDKDYKKGLDNAVKAKNFALCLLATSKDWQALALLRHLKKK